MSNKSRKFEFGMAGLILLLFGFGLFYDAEPGRSSQVLPTEENPLLLDADLYCSLSVYDEDKPELRIIGAEREYERNTFSDGDVVYINQGVLDGLEAGQLFLILEIEENIPSYGPLAVKRGRLRLQALAEHKASAIIEKACSSIKLGSYLVPFEPKDTVTGKDAGYDIPPFEVEGAKGQVIFLETEFNQVGTGHWALINVGEADGITIGRQMIAYRIIKEGAPVQIFGNVIVVDVQMKTATIKVLSCRDALRIGDQVMYNPLAK